MNKQQLVDAVGERLGDRKTAATAVYAVLSTVSGTLADPLPFDVDIYCVNADSLPRLLADLPPGHMATRRRVGPAAQPPTVQSVRPLHEASVT